MGFNFADEAEAEFFLAAVNENLRIKSEKRGNLIKPPSSFCFYFINFPFSFLERRRQSQINPSAQSKPVATSNGSAAARPSRFPD